MDHTNQVYEQLKTFITKNLYLSTGYRLERFRNPGNLMLGAGWRFNAR